MRRLAQNKKFGEEAKLAMGFQAKMKELGATCYPELDRVDLVVKRSDGEIWAVEVKVQANIKVFAQAWASRMKADRIFVVVPLREYTRGEEGHETREFVKDICLRFGIGLYTVQRQYGKPWEDWKPGDPPPPCDVQMIYNGEKRFRTDTSWDKLMVPEAETFSVAGGSGVKAFTEFRLWEIEVRKFVQENPGKTCEEILRALRPPGTNKRTGKPLVVRKQDQEILYYNIGYRFEGLITKGDPDNNDFRAARVWTTEQYYKGLNT